MGKACRPRGHSLFDGPWEVQWSSDEFIQIFLSNADKEEAFPNIIANQIDSGSGSAYQPRGGSYYLKVNAAGNWRIKVVAIKNPETGEGPSGGHTLEEDMPGTGPWVATPSEQVEAPQPPIPPTQPQVSTPEANKNAALPPDWSDWEIKNSVAREQDWLVIRQPGEVAHPGESPCYLKQSYESDSSKMEMSLNRTGEPHIVTPFFRGIDGSVTFRVDDGESGVIDQFSKFWAITLPANLIPALKTGRTLTVEVTPVGEQRRAQSFSLLGFDAATKWLERRECQ